MLKIIKILSQLKSKYPEKALEYISEQEISNFFDSFKESVIRYKNMEAENRQLKSEVLLLKNKIGGNV